MIGVRGYSFISNELIKAYWKQAEAGLCPLPWQAPPKLSVFGPISTQELRALILTTNSNTVWEVSSYQEFYRLMVIGGVLYLVHPNGDKEVVITAHGRFIFEGEAGKVLQFPNKVL